MSFEELEEIIDRAIGTLYARDAILLKKGDVEWSIAHRFAVYLEEHFPEWNIDCEYNRQDIGIEPKRNEEGSRKRPDIIVHHREKTEKQHNLLVIEIKVGNTIKDEKKIKDYTSPSTGSRPYQYQYGLALSFIPEIQKKWFENGEERPILPKS